MTKRIFVPFGDPVTAEDLNKWESLRADIFGEPATKDDARAAISAAAAVHGHDHASPSVGGIGGSPGFISAVDLERLRRFSSYPIGGTSPSPSGTYAVPMISETGSVVFVTISDLQTVFGSGGGGVVPTDADGGESETTTFASELDGGESETTIFSTELDGGEA